MKKLILTFFTCIFLCSAVFAADVSNCKYCRGTNIRVDEKLATCTTDGYLKYYCRNCNVYLASYILPAYGHRPSTETVDPTCTTEGYTKEICLDCGEVLSNTTLPIKDHFFEKHSKEPSCDGPGYTRFVCRYCGLITDNVEIPETHTVVVEETPADCITGGYRFEYCILCKKEILYTILSPLGHSEVEQITDPTCTENGLRFVFCETCGIELENEVLSALGHDYIENIESRVEPSYSVDGVRIFECSHCEDSYSVAIPKLGCDVHDFLIIDEVEATPEIAGSIVYECKSCGLVTRSAVDYASSIHADTEELGRGFLSGVWKLFDIYVPGFGFTFGQMYIGIALCSISVLVAKLFFGMGGGGGSSYRTGSTNNPKISKERRNDEY